MLDNFVTYEEKTGGDSSCSSTATDTRRLYHRQNNMSKDQNLKEMDTSKRQLKFLGYYEKSRFGNLNTHRKVRLMKTANNLPREFG